VNQRQPFKGSRSIFWSGRVACGVESTADKSQQSAVLWLAFHGTWMPNAYCIVMPRRERYLLPADLVCVVTQPLAVFWHNRGHDWGGFVARQTSTSIVLFIALSMNLRLDCPTVVRPDQIMGKLPCATSPLESQPIASLRGLSCIAAGTRGKRSRSLIISG
jgi:hypothetical protein